MEKNLELKNIINNLPETPGVYQYFNIGGEIIYVGKAKNLKRRVSSYFNKDYNHTPKTKVLVSQIHTLKYIVVPTEEDALLLENNLIKKYKPRYNILLKDDKTYPSICITKEPFPRVIKTRNIVKNGSEYFGPYSSVMVANNFLKFLHEIYPIRTCKHFLNSDNIKKKKYKVCLQYHIKKCNGVCVGMESEKDYQKMIDEIRELIKGNVQKISNTLLEEMRTLSKEYRFEEAQKIKEKYNLIEHYKSKSVVVNPTLSNIDVFSYDEYNNSAFVNMLRIQNGSIIQGLTIEYKKQLDEPKEEILGIAIAELRERFESKSHEILVPFYPDIDINSALISIPQRGDKKKLLDLSIQNVKQYKLDKIKQTEKLNPDQRMIRILGSLQKMLQLKELPIHIECFDNSNIQGSDAVAACVVFKKAKPSKKDYRKYIIKSENGNDDYNSMKEVVYRRYSRLINENLELPNLIIADGGIGQMNAIRTIVEDELHLSIPIVGLAKDGHHKTSEVLFGFPPKVVGMKVTDESFRFLASIQEEVHRFAISFHRQKRNKNQITSELDSILGIGEKTKKLLLLEFKSVKRAKSATLEELKKIVGSSKASILYEHFHKG